MKRISQFAFNNVMRNKEYNATHSDWFNHIQDDTTEIRHEIDYTFQYGTLLRKISLLLGKY